MKFTMEKLKRNLLNVKKKNLKEKEKNMRNKLNNYDSMFDQVYNKNE